MEAVLQWGLYIVRAVQTIASVQLSVIVRIITSFGGAGVYFIMLPVFFWCIDEKKGFNLGIMILLSLWINVSLKFLFNQPRPFFPDYDPSVGIVSENMGGLPSGHAQNSLVIYFLIASWLKKKMGIYLRGRSLSFNRLFQSLSWSAFPNRCVCGLDCRLRYSLCVFSFWKQN